MNDFTISVSVDLRESKLDGSALLYEALNQDSGFIRWGFMSARANRKREGDQVTYRYQATYRTTLEQDETARAIASEIVGQWDLSGLSSRQKADMLKNYILANWSYDDSLQNLTAYSTLTEKKGVCLGLTLASQLILDQMGVPSRTVNGKIISTRTLHILLLVKIDDLWYTFDPTELLSNRKNPAYLKDDYGAYFTPDPMYLTDSFRRDYPMKAEDYYITLTDIPDGEIPLSGYPDADGVGFSGDYGVGFSGFDNVGDSWAKGYGGSAVGAGSGGISEIGYSGAGGFFQGMPLVVQFFNMAISMFILFFMYSLFRKPERFL